MTVSLFRRGRDARRRRERAARAPIVSPSGAIKINHEDISAMGATCALHVADTGPRTLDEVGRLLNVTRERARQIEQAALTKIRITARMKGL